MHRRRNIEPMYVTDDLQRVEEESVLLAEAKIASLEQEVRKLRGRNGQLRVRIHVTVDHCCICSLRIKRNVLSLCSAEIRHIWTFSRRKIGERKTRSDR